MDRATPAHYVARRGVGWRYAGTLSASQSDGAAAPEPPHALSVNGGLRPIRGAEDPPSSQLLWWLGKAVRCSADALRGRASARTGGPPHHPFPDALSAPPAAWPPCLQRAFAEYSTRLAPTASAQPGGAASGHRCYPRDPAPSLFFPSQQTSDPFWAAGVPRGGAAPLRSAWVPLPPAHSGQCRNSRRRSARRAAHMPPPPALIIHAALDDAADNGGARLAGGV